VAQVDELIKVFTVKKGATGDISLWLYKVVWHQSTAILWFSALLEGES